MANNDGFDNENENENDGKGGSGKGLRAQLEAALAELGTLKQERDALAQKTRQLDLAAFLKSNGAKAGAEKLYPKDAEVSEAAIKQWVEENAAFVRDAGSDSGSDDGDAGNGQLNVSDTTRTNAQRLSSLSDLATQRPAGGGAEQLIERMKAARNNPDELRAIYAEAGIRYQ